MRRRSKKACQIASDRPFHQKASLPRHANTPLTYQECLEKAVALDAIVLDSSWGRNESPPRHSSGARERGASACSPLIVVVQTTWHWARHHVPVTWWCSWSPWLARNTLLDVPVRPGVKCCLYPFAPRCRCFSPRVKKGVQALLPQAPQDNSTGTAGYC